MVHVAEGSGLRQGMRRAVVLALLMSPLPAAPRSGSAQQLPATVASDLVGRALTDTLELYASGDGEERPTRSMPPSVVVVGVLLLLAAVGRWVWAQLRSRSGRGGQPKADPKAASGPEAGQRRRPASIPGARPKATMQLPPHVVEIMRRAEQRRAQEALDAAGAQSDDEGPAVEQPARGIDIVVPR